MQPTRCCCTFNWLHFVADAGATVAPTKMAAIAIATTKFFMSYSPRDSARQPLAVCSRYLAGLTGRIQDSRLSRSPTDSDAPERVLLRSRRLAAKLLEQRTGWRRLRNAASTDLRYGRSTFLSRNGNGHRAESKRGDDGSNEQISHGQSLQNFYLACSSEHIDIRARNEATRCC